MLAEKCGVFGVYSKSEDVARLTYYALSTLQHRGQESAGIVTSDGTKFYSHIQPGLVAQVFNEETLDGLEGHLAIGHNRYSTSKGRDDNHHLQPVLRTDDIMALAHNGNLPSVRVLKQFLASKNLLKPGNNDSELMTDAIRYYLYQGKTMPEAIKKAWPMFTGAFSCVLLSQDKLYAFRDKRGIRPLSLAKLNGGYVVASETCVFDALQAKFIRDIKPGELVEISPKGLVSTQIERGHEQLEVFEYIYFARADSHLQGQSVNEVRRRLGVQTARENPVEADVVIPIPDSAIPASIGYAQESGIPFDFGLIKNRYVHRTFIRPDQTKREKDVQLKLNPLRDALKGKRVVVIDDSLVRGTTTGQIVKMLRNVGVSQIHLRISSPPVLYPDFYGIDTPNQEKLIAARLKQAKKVQRYVGATSLKYLSYKGMLEAIGIPENQLCTACFSGNYPVDILERKKEFKKVSFTD